MRSRVRSYPLASFFLIALGFTYLVWLPAVAAGGFAKLPALFTLLLQVLAPFGPVVAAFTVVMAEGRYSLKAYAKDVLVWRTNPLWYGAAFFIPVVTMLAAYGLLRTFSAVPAGMFESLSVVSYSLVFVLVLLVGGGQEELGWRGFALPRLRARWGVWTSSLILGLLWALWHLPLWCIPEAPQYVVSFYLYLLHMLAYSLLFTWLYEHTGGSVFACMIMHASGNAFPAVTVLAVAPERFAAFFVPLLVIEGLLAVTLCGSEFLSPTWRRLAKR